MEQHKEIFRDDDLHFRLWRLKEQLRGGERLTGEMLARIFDEMQAQMTVALSKRKFAYIPPPNDEYFEQEKLFGEEVYLKFEKARSELKDAGNCFAAGLPTACVFHLMRVAEFGLREIAKKVRVRLIDKGKPHPVEFATWDKVIQGINNQITAARTLPHGQRKNKRLQFHSNAAEQCTYIRDLWRNDVSHTRKRYSDNEALGILGRVRDFMQLLAKGMW
jgi:hypothetical protein